MGNVEQRIVVNGKCIFIGLIFSNGKQMLSLHPVSESTLTGLLASHLVMDTSTRSWMAREEEMWFNQFYIKLHILHNNAGLLQIG